MSTGAFGRGMSCFTTATPGRRGGEAGRGQFQTAETKAVIASEAKQSISRLEERMDCFVAPLLAMTAKHNPAISRRDAPEVYWERPALSKQRARGGRAPDAPDSRVCK
jgi:hypothetical protein